MLWCAAFHGSAGLACRGHEVLTVVPRYSPYEGVEPTGISVPLDLPQPNPELPLQHPGSTPNEAAAADAVAQPIAPEAAAPVIPLQAAGGGQPAAELGSLEAAEQGAQREDSADQEEPAAVPLERQELAQHAELYQCWQGGVHRVFVDHPLFHSSGGPPRLGWASAYTSFEQCLLLMLLPHVR